ncbi:Presenilin-1 [Dinochytrium kinnereticum]|nr:Presenilin-1 [Dinochytrium kinnereticum]
MCSRCGPKVHYCSQECQAQDWPDHRLNCTGMKSSRTDEEPQISGNRGEVPLPPNVETLENGESMGSLRRRNRADPDAVSLADTISRGRLTGRGNAAQVINERGGGRWRKFFSWKKREEAEPEEEEPPLTEEEQIEELKFYMNNIYLIIKPVICCILLSVLWIKLTRLQEPFFGTGIDSFNDIFGGGIGSAVGGGSPPGDTQASVFNALMILGMIIVVTIIILVLFKYNQMKILYGIFGVIVLSLLGLFGFTLGLELLSVYNGALDYVTFFFFLWNLCAVGLVVIFWKGPLVLQQIYLVIMSSKMAFALSALPAVTTWVLLALLAIWDLIAVLCPFGPLRLLIESSKENQREIPALLYTAAVWVGMATPPSPPPSRAGNASTRSISDTIGESRSIYHAASTADLINNRNTVRESMDMPTSPAATTAPLNNRGTAEEEAAKDEQDGDGAATATPEEEEESSGLKLGLGDFVFYSVLVARAAVFDWVTTVAVMVAVMTGLNMTIFLLAIWHKALPALPISIAFGLLFYFVSSITLTPYENNLMNIPDRLRIVRSDTSGLWVGKSGGAGLVYI